VRTRGLQICLATYRVRRDEKLVLSLLLAWPPRATIRAPRVASARKKGLAQVYQRRL